MQQFHAFCCSGEERGNRSTKSGFSTPPRHGFRAGDRVGRLAKARQGKENSTTSAPSAPWRTRAGMSRAVSGASIFPDGRPGGVLGREEAKQSGGEMSCVDIHGMNSYHIGMKTVVSERGQVTIPKPLRKRLGIRPGQVLDFKEEAGRLVATKRAPEDPVEGVYGILKLGRLTDDLISSLRGDPDRV